MNATTPTLLLTTRFGLGVRDRHWFDHRLRLIEAITAPSLAGQTRQDFIWAVFVDPDLDSGVRAELERIIAPAGRPLLYDAGPHNTRSVLALAAELDVARNGYLLSGRIDDDDAWRRDTVEQVYGTVGEWLERHAATRRPGVAVTFAHGLEWLMYDMVDVNKRAQGRHVVRRQSLRPYTYPWIAMSVFALTDLAAQVTAISAKHTAIAEKLRAEGLDLVVRDDESDMWLYTRHKQVTSSLQKARANACDADTGELQARFGLNAALVDRYIAASDTYGYTIEKRTIARRTALTRELEELERRLADPSLAADEAMRLGQLHAERRDELTRISQRLVGNIDGPASIEPVAGKPIEQEEPRAPQHLEPRALQRVIQEHYSARIQMSVGQVTAVGSAIRAAAPGANVLVFGCGNDSELWHAINDDGYTLFLEDSPEWIEKVRRRSPHLNVEQVSYGDRTVETSLPIDEEALSLYPMPAAMVARPWDVIVIDAPRGHKPWLPGRSLPIYWSAQVARPETQVFVDDYSRRLEKAYVDRFFCPTRPWRMVVPRIVQAGRPTTSALLWLVGAAAVFQEAALEAQSAEA